MSDISVNLSGIDEGKVLGDAVATTVGERLEGVTHIKKVVDSQQTVTKTVECTSGNYVSPDSDNTGEQTEDLPSTEVEEPQRGPRAHNDLWGDSNEDSEEELRKYPSEDVDKT